MDSRFTFNNCSLPIFDGFMGEVKNIANIMNHKPASNDSPQERYTLSLNGSRASIVYETKSLTLVITADKSIAEKINGIYESVAQKHNGQQKNKVKKPQHNQNAHSQAPGKRQDARFQEQGKNQNVSLPEQASELLKKKNGAEQDNKFNEQSRGKNSSKHLPDERHSISVDDILNEEAIALGGKKSKEVNPHINKNSNPAKNKADANGGNRVAAGSFAVDKAKNKSGSNDVANKAGEANPHINKNSNPAKNKADANGKNKAIEAKSHILQEVSRAKEKESVYSLKKFTKERFSALLSKIKSEKKYKCKIQTDNSESVCAVLSDKSQSLFINFDKNKRTIYITGKPGGFFDEIKSFVELNGDYKTAIASYIKLTGEEKRAWEIQRELKRKLPDAFDFLSEQSKIDLAIGLIDILNDSVKLSDYSMLLVPPYRGLERFIYDLQITEKIEVKLIGQAFDKQDGVYKLKTGYQRRIKSVIYNEVLVALYTEYYNKRNFYAHSDNTSSSTSRIITDRNQVKQIYLDLLELLNYNCKKLKEIGFTMA